VAAAPEQTVRARSRCRSSRQRSVCRAPHFLAIEPARSAFGPEWSDEPAEISCLIVRRSLLLTCYPPPTDKDVVHDGVPGVMNTDQKQHEYCGPDTKQGLFYM
jgi:hypothetical protein